MTESKQTNAAISLDNVSFSYNAKPVLENVNLHVQENDFVWIVGPNGGGKTTLVKIVLGLLSPKAGKVRIFGKSASAARRRIGYMPQHAQLDLRFPVTARDVVLMGRLNKGFMPGAGTRTRNLETGPFLGAPILLCPWAAIEAAPA